MKLPSKELLSEVFGREVSEIKNTCTDKEIVIIAYFDGFRQAFTMNIYELAFKCKEWALSKGYIVASGLNEEGRWWCDVSEVKIFHAINGTYVQDTEMEAVIKACEWIRTNNVLR